LRTYRKYEEGCPQRSGWSSFYFAEIYNVSLDWLLSGDGVDLGQHLTRRAAGKLAILPVANDAGRRRQA